MITSAVNPNQIETWKKIYAENRQRMFPNRISGEQLDSYFREKYHPNPFDSKKFRKVVLLNAAQNEGRLGQPAFHVVTYRIDDAIVGIDLTTGFFHVESEDTKQMISIYDDLFVTRGLNEKDLENYVITAKYLELTGK